MRHAVSCMEALQAKYSPMIFKFGISHDVVKRWENKEYGYKHEACKWQAMQVIFLSPEQFSPAMLEAALIEKYGGSLACMHLTQPTCFNLANTTLEVESFRYVLEIRIDGRTKMS